MNIKLHTPKSLKMGSGMSSVKQFLLSLFATSVSIALTFGTAGYLDYKKKQSEKRETGPSCSAAAGESIITRSAIRLATMTSAL